MAKTRLDHELVKRKLANTRSQAENFIRLGEVTVDGSVVAKPGFFVADSAKIKIMTNERYVSRAALKLASVAHEFDLSFKDKVILDVGSSTGGFTDFALQNGAKKSIAVEVGTDQLHPSLQGNERIELHEQTDIRDIQKLSTPADIVVIDVSFISLKAILPHVFSLVTPEAQIIAMLKPQFEASANIKHKGIIKNERLRREILKDFETWVKQYGVIKNKADSKVSGAKGNLARFYLLHKL